LATDSGVCYYAANGFDCSGVCLLDQDQDGVCDVEEIFGCMDVSACNYSNEATEEAGTCVYPDPWLNCEGICWNDADADGVCDELEIMGCMDSLACNFLVTATDEGLCLYPIQEICNEQDDNCDGEIDNGLTFVQWYSDNDQDGFGQSWVAYTCADPLPGWSQDSTDCDDNNALVNPGAIEIVDNLLDDNCDGEIATSVIEWLEQERLIFPNPLSQNCFYLKMSSQQAKVTVYNEIGEQVLVQNWSNGDCIEIQQANGLYIVVIQLQQKVIAQYLMIAR